MLLAVLQPQGSGPAGALQLIDLNGQLAAQTPLSMTATVVGAAGGRAVFSDGQELAALRPDGQVERLATLAAKPDAVAMSPDGSQWVWSTTDWSGGQQSRSTIYLGNRQIATLTEQQPRHWIVRSWSAAGVVIEDAPTGLGGNYLFDASAGATQLLDVRTGSRRPLTDEQCYLAALAADGTVACTYGRLGVMPRAIHVTRPSGASFEVPLPADRFQVGGDASFDPGPNPSKLVIGGAPGVSSGTALQQYETDVLDLNSHALRPVGGAGLRPGYGSWAWLPDGSIVCYRGQYTEGGRLGVYLVAHDGATREVAPSVVPRGAVVVAGN